MVCASEQELRYLPSEDDLTFEREITSVSAYCSVCARPLGDVRWKCRTCNERLCSEECREAHERTMDAV